MTNSISPIQSVQQVLDIKSDIAADAPRLCRPFSTSRVAGREGSQSEQATLEQESDRVLKSWPRRARGATKPASWSYGYVQAISQPAASRASRRILSGKFRVVVQD